MLTGTRSSILFAYRVGKQASICISPFFMMYGREPKNEAEAASSTNDQTAEIPVRTPVDSDDNTLPDLTVDEPPAPPHVHTPSVSSTPLHVCTPSYEPPTLLHVRTPSKLFPGHTPSSSNSFCPFR